MTPEMTEPQLPNMVSLVEAWLRSTRCATLYTPLLCSVIWLLCNSAMVAIETKQVLGDHLHASAVTAVLKIENRTSSGSFLAIRIDLALFVGKCN